MMWLALALAGPVDIAVEDAPLRPGRAVTVVVTAEGEVPPLQVGGATARAEDAGEGWQRYVVVPSGGPMQLVADSVLRRFDVRPPPPSSLDVPTRVEGTVGAERVEVPVVGDVGPDALEVVLSEGALVDVVDAPDGLTLVLSPDGGQLPRMMMVGIRDTRTDSAPAWVPVRLRARPRLPIRAEPGASLTVRVGERNYGPFDADASGQIEAVVDQYPGEAVARAVLRDDLGNETRTDMPLPVVTDTRLVSMVGGALVPRLRPPTLYIAAFRADGASMRFARPTCRTPDADLTVNEVEPGAWGAPLPVLPGRDPTDQRISCRLGDSELTARVTIPDDVPHVLRVRTFPDEVRADFPEAELRVVLEDVRGERLSPDRVEVEAEKGLIQLDPVRGDVLRGLWDGREAVEPGADTIVARLEPLLGEGATQAVGAGWTRSPQGLRLYGSALDRLGRPLQGVSLQLRFDDETVARGVTDGNGFFSTTVPDARGLHRLEVVHDLWRSEQVVHPADAGGLHPASAALETRVQLPVRAGSLSGIRVVVDPPVLRAAPGAVAWVSVTLEDRGGLPLREAGLTLEASEGEVGTPRQRSDGTWVAEYLPAEGGGARDVTLTAQSEGVRSSTTLSVEPRVVRMSLGPWVGGVSNFGEVGTWSVGFDLDVRLRSRFVGEAMMVRAGAWGYGVSSEIPDEDLGLRGSVVPAYLAFLLRQDAGRFGIWGGGGGAVALHRLQLRADNEVVSEGYRGLGGPTLLAGVGMRALGGEAVVEVRGLWLDGPTGAVGWNGNLGGLAAGLGWRVLY